MDRPGDHHPFVLSLSKDFLLLTEGKGFDRLSPNGKKDDCPTDGNIRPQPEPEDSRSFVAP
jgi:hypothetical protein